MSFGFSELPKEPKQGEHGPPSLANLCVTEISSYVRIWFASKLLDAPQQPKEHDLESFFLSDSEEGSCEEDIEINALDIRTPQLVDEIDESFEDLARILTSEQKGALLSIVAQKSRGFGFDHVEPWVNSLAAEANALDFTACTKMEADTLRSMLTCSQALPLTSLNLSECSGLLSPSLLAEAAACMPHLCELRLSGGYTAYSPAADAALMRVASLCPNLRLIDLAACNTVGDAAIREILGSCSSLQHLDVSGCRQVTDDAFSAPLASSSLQALKLWGCRLSDEAMEHLSGNAELALAELNVLGTFISGGAIARLPQLSCLRTLVVGELEVTDDELRRIAASAPNLTAVDLSWCDYLSDRGVGALAGHCPGLTSLNLRKSQVTDAAMLAIGQGCPALERLGVALCEQISDAGILAVGAGCHRLRVLDVSWCSRLSGDALLGVVASLSALTSLSLQGCKPVENRHLKEVQRTLTGLRQLSIAWCNLPTSEAIADLTAALPRLTVYDYYNIRHEGALTADRRP